MSTSAIVLGAGGVAGTFMPDEVLHAAGIAASPSMALVIQLYAATLFGWAMLNWTARGNLIGGVYNRPVAIGNLAHFAIGALAAAKSVAAGHVGGIAVGTTAVYVVFAVAFAIVFATTPVKERT